MSQDELLDYAQAAAYLGVKSETIQVYVAQGKLLTEGKRGSRCIRRSALDAYRASSAIHRDQEEENVFVVFDAERFFADLDVIRRRHRRSWNGLLRMTEAYAGAVSTLLKGANPRINTILPLAVWAGLSLNNYIVDNRMNRE